MSEKDKMLAGELYDANYDKELIKDRYKAKDICFEYNNLKPSDFESKDRIIKKLFAKTGEQIIVVLPGVTIGDNVVIGAGSVVNKDIPSNSVAVGNPCKVIKEI